MPCIHVYTKPVDKYDPAGLACAIHVSLEDKEDVLHLNHGHGLLYAPAVLDKNDQIVPRFLQSPRIERMPMDWFRITADVVDEDGHVLDCIAWETMEFDYFHPCQPGKGKSDTIRVNRDIAKAIRANWVVECKKVTVPKMIHLSELAQTPAEVRYTDGSRHEKAIDWDLTGIDLNKPGKHKINGRIRTHRFGFPLMENTGDPVLLNWEGKWHFFYTHDATDGVGFYVRRADTVEGLFAEGCEESCILEKNEERGFIQTFWAPETHVIGGRLHLLFAISGKVWGPQCQIMRLKEGGDPFLPGGWEMPRPVLRKDGTPLFADQLNIDMTYLDTPDGQYYVWSTRRDCMGPTDSGSMLAIARVDPADPWTITTDPLILTRPMLGFENVSGTINNEGPYALIRDDTVWLFYSGGDSAGYTYCLGLMKANVNADLMDLASWEKAPYPLLHYRALDQVYGPGHHSFFELEGDTYIAYHGETTLDNRIRCTTIHRVHFDKEGRPRLDMIHQRDLPAEKENVSTILVIK